MAIQLRPAGREDGKGDALDRLWALDQSCFRTGIAWSRADLRHFLLHPWAVSLIAEQGDALAGFAIAEMEHHAGHIATIDVDPAFRRQGVGRMLMDTLAERCREHGATLLLLEVAVDNQPALVFYRTLGFVETGRIPNFYPGKLDALTMEKRIGAGFSLGSSSKYT